MDRERYLILINGQDKTDSVKEFRPCGDACDIIYTSSSQVYHYQGGKVKILELRQRIDPTGLIVTVKGVRMDPSRRSFRFWGILSHSSHWKEGSFPPQGRCGNSTQLSGRGKTKECL